MAAGAPMDEQGRLQPEQAHLGLAGGHGSSGTESKGHPPRAPPPPPTQPLLPPAAELSAPLRSPAPAPARRLGMSAHARTTLLINLSSVMERVDEQLLPALYSRVGRSLAADPQHLGTLTFARAVVQALASPLAGFLGQYADRVHVIAAGAALWGACCLGFATVHSVGAGLPLWALNGVGLALLIPAAQSMTADGCGAEQRGRAFGLLYLTGAVGALVGALGATNLGHARPLGIEGWRFAFGLVALASWLIGAATLALAVDPRYTPEFRAAAGGAAGEAQLSWRAALREAGAVLRVPSFLIIVSQGIVGTAPWLALVFLTLYLQLLGMSDAQASLLVACFLGASAAGGLLGGALGDAAALRWPNHGRVAVCQLSVAAGVPLAALLFKCLPMSAGAGATALYALVLVCMGLAITWAAPACNNPVFAEIVPSRLRNLVYSFDRSFEGAVAACAAPLVGWLARVGFGFHGTAEVGPSTEANLAKARALAGALAVFTTVPWTLCLLLFTPLHWTYPRDRRRAQEAAAADGAAAEALLSAACAPQAAGVELVAAAGRPSTASSYVELEAGWASAEEKLEEEAAEPAAAEVLEGSA